MRDVLAILLVTSLCACSSTPRNGVRITHDAAVVEHCKHIGAVQTVPPYAVPGEDMEKIRARTLEIGADTVLLDTSRKAATSGVAYRCGVT